MTAACDHAGMTDRIIDADATREDDAVEASIRPRDLSECRPGGLGINFIDETMDRWRLRPLRRGGNLLVMRKRIRSLEHGGT